MSIRAGGMPNRKIRNILINSINIPLISLCFIAYVGLLVWLAWYINNRIYEDNAKIRPFPDDQAANMQLLFMFLILLSPITLTIVYGISAVLVLFVALLFSTKNDYEINRLLYQNKPMDLAFRFM